MPAFRCVHGGAWRVDAEWLGRLVEPTIAKRWGPRVRSENSGQELDKPPGQRYLLTIGLESWNRSSVAQKRGVLCKRQDCGAVGDTGKYRISLFV